MIWFVSRYRWRYNMYLNTYSKMDIMSCMKAVTPVIMSTAHKLLLQWMEHLLLQLLLVEPKHEFPKFYQIMSINLIWKKYVLLFVIFKNACASSFMWFVIHWVCCIDTYHKDKISVCRNAPVNRYTLNQTPGHYLHQFLHFSMTPFGLTRP